MKKNDDKNALSYWFPKIAAAGLPVPKTVIVEMPEEATCVVWEALDGQDAPVENVLSFDIFIATLGDVIKGLGLPAFLRTDHTSGKHNWKQCCYVTDVDTLGQHIFALVEQSEMAGMLGLPWEKWVAREYLPVEPVDVCPNYGNMPVNKEYRFFVDNGVIRCLHPYWPRKALEQGGAKMSEEAYRDLCTFSPYSIHAWEDLATRAGKAVGGSWSIDILETKKGLYVTDMALAEDSFHWKGCPNQYQ